MSSPILGPLFEESSFMLGIDYGDEKRIAVYSNTIQMYYFSNDIDEMIDDKSYAIFTAKPYNGGFLLYDIGLKKYVMAQFDQFLLNPYLSAGKSSLPALGYPEASSHTIVLSTDVVQWTPGQLMSTSYGIKISNSTIYTSLLRKSFTRTPLSNIQLIPVNSYFNAGCSITANPANSILMYVCPDLTISSCLTEDIPQVAWTTQELCQVSRTFNYCVGNEHCGDSDCNGPCSGGSDAMANVCHPSGDTYTCKVEPIPPEAIPWWKSPWFIWSAVGLAVFIGVLVAIVILLLIIRHNQNKKAAEEEQSDAERKRFNRLISTLGT